MRMDDASCWGWARLALGHEPQCSVADQEPQEAVTTCRPPSTGTSSPRWTARQLRGTQEPERRSRRPTDLPVVAVPVPVCAAGRRNVLAGVPRSERVRSDVSVVERASGRSRRNDRAGHPSRRGGDELGRWGWRWLNRSLPLGRSPTPQAGGQGLRSSDRATDVLSDRGIGRQLACESRWDAHSALLSSSAGRAAHITAGGERLRHRSRASTWRRSQRTPPEHRGPRAQSPGEHRGGSRRPPGPWDHR